MEQNMDKITHKINLHAHTEHSDGAHSILSMAAECKSLGFSACVITDHVYSKASSSDRCTLNFQKYEDAIYLASVASRQLGNYPIICGAEVSVPEVNEEILVYGTYAVRQLLDWREKEYAMNPDDTFRFTLQHLRKVKNSFRDCAMIIAHPAAGGRETTWRDSDPDARVYQQKLFRNVDIFDGFEFVNSGSCQFWAGEADSWNEATNRFRPGSDSKRVPREFSALTPWCNSDAHSSEGLQSCYNEIDYPIVTERELIDTIKQSAPIRFINYAWEGIR